MVSLRRVSAFSAVLPMALQEKVMGSRYLHLHNLSPLLIAQDAL
jgi:hypothetical protein